MGCVKAEAKTMIMAPSPIWEIVNSKLPETAVNIMAMEDDIMSTDI